MPSGSVAAAVDNGPGAAVDAPQIELRGVRKVFDDVVAVAGADLTVGDGELFAILGPSGSGKTTVLRMIAGFERPTAGTVHLGGRDVTALPPARRDTNTVFQDYALFPHMTVAQNVEYGLRVKGVAKAERRDRTAAALEMVRLSGHAGRKPAQLSGGQQQRVALARALVGRPRVLLLDEPLGALDLKLREQMQEELKSLQRALGITFVFVTHDQGEALSMADRVAVFNNGGIVQAGAPEDIYQRPASKFVADFVGSSNVLSPDLTARLTGERAWSSVRPELIALGSPGEDAIGFSGTLATRSFLGSVMRIGVDADGERLHANLPAASALPPDGEAISLHFPRTALTKLDDAA